MCAEAGSGRKLGPVQTGAKGSRDGRTVRAERTRQALVEALHDLLGEGELRPTAERIAGRAGVSERSVFQHFPDREVLLEAVARQQYEQIVRELVPVDASLPLPERIDAFVAERTRMLEQITPVRRAAVLIEHESDVVAGWLTTARRGAATEVERVFRRELETLERGERGGAARRARVRLRLAGLGELPRPSGAGRRARAGGDANDRRRATRRALSGSPGSPARRRRSARPSCPPGGPPRS